MMREGRECFNQSPKTLLKNVKIDLFHNSSFEFFSFFVYKVLFTLKF